MPLTRRGPARLLTALLALAWSALAAAAGGGTGPGAELLERSNQMLRGQSSRGTYRVEVVRPEWRKVLRFRGAYDYAGERFRMEVLKPRKSAGTVFLKVGGRLSMYLPKLGRRVAISPAMMPDPWMGSDFTNHDLLEADSPLRDYNHVLMDWKEPEDAPPYAVIESRPRDGGDVPWGHLKQYVREDGVPMRVEYYNCRDEKVRVLSFHDVQTIAGRPVPMRWEMRPTEDPERYTVVQVEELEFVDDLPEELFSPPES